jgi:hypothetical protein
MKYNSENNKRRVIFNIKFDKKIVIVEYSKLYLIFQVEYLDTNIFIALKKLDDKENKSDLYIL